MLLQDKAILVTGAAQGLGQEFALRLAAEGAFVLAADRQNATATVEKIIRAGGRAEALPVDVADSASVARLAQEAARLCGRLDGLVNNAAVYAGLTMLPFDEIPEEEWDRVLAVNAKGVWICCKYLYPLMKEKGGSIVNVASATIFEGHPYFAHYVASKGAVWALSRSIARNLGQWDIRVNSITPGYTLTETSKNLAGDREKFEENYQKTISTRAIRRAMEPGDVVGTVVFLMSGDSAFITGQNINIDGGSIHY